MRERIVLSRRDLIILAAAGSAGRLFGAAQDFWNKKPPSEWSAEEVERLLTNSPWAKEAAAEYADRPEAPAASTRRRISIPGMARRSGESSYVASVIWESAPPVQDAVKTPLPDTFANHYAITLGGIPFSEEDVEPLKQTTFLQPKGKAETKPDLVKREISNGNLLLFGFAKDAIQIGAEDREVLFQTVLGGLRVKARFNPKEMTYKGELAL